MLRAECQTVILRIGSSDFQLRAATGDDLESIEDCVKSAYRHYEQCLDSLPAPMLQNYRQIIADCEVFVTVSNGETLGVVVLRQTHEGYLLDNVAVSPKAQGRGIRRMLLAHAEIRARLAGYDSIYLYTNLKMLENRELYARIGYQEFDRRTEDGLSRVYMRKHLPKQTPA